MRNLNREAYMPTILRRFRRALFITLLPWLLAAQTTHIAVLPPPSAPLGFLTARYKPRVVPSVNLNNSGRLASLVRSGTLYLTAQDAIALTLENNIDIEMQRYGPLMAREDIRRAEVGGALRSPTTPIVPGPQSVSLAGINVSGSMASGAGVGSGGGVTGLLGAFVPQTDPVLSLSASLGHSTSPESNIIVDQTNSLVQGSRALQRRLQPAVHDRRRLQRLLFGVARHHQQPQHAAQPRRQRHAQPERFAESAAGVRHVRSTRATSASPATTPKSPDLQLKQQVVTTVSAVLNLYWDLVAFHEDVRLKQLALEAARKLYEDNRKTVEAGGAAAIEITRAQAEIPAREQDVLIAQTNVLQQEIVLKNALSRRGIEDPLIADALHRAARPHRGARYRGTAAGERSPGAGPGRTARPATEPHQLGEPEPGPQGRPERAQTVACRRSSPSPTTARPAFPIRATSTTTTAFPTRSSWAAPAPCWDSSSAAISRITPPEFR